MMKQEKNKDTENKEITVTKKNVYELKSVKEDFKTLEEYNQYLEKVKQFKNNTKYTFKNFCYRCSKTTITYHWILKCASCKLDLQCLGKWLEREMFQHLTGFWDPKNIAERHKNSSIYVKNTSYKK